MPRWLTLITISVLLSPPVLARDIYVNNLGGDDSFDGSAPQSRGQRSGPCRSIGRALRLATKGDRVIVANTGEAYHESITLQGGRHSGYASKSFEVLGNGAILDGSQPVPADAWEHVKDELFRFEPKLKSFQQLFIDDLPVERLRIPADGKMPKLEPLQWCLFQRYIYFHVERGLLPQDYNITYAGHPVGITLYEVRNVVIRDVTVQGFQLDGINAHDNAMSATIVGCICRGNGRSGISVGGASRVRLQSCLVGNNGDAQVRTEGYSKTWIVDCDLLDNTAPKIVREAGRVFVEKTAAADPGTD